MRKAVTALCLLFILASVPLVGGSPNVIVSISSVDVSTSTPAPGEPVTFTATVRNLEGSNSSFKINSAFIRDPELTSYGHTSGIGTLAPGTSLDIPITTSFDTSGTKELRVMVYGRDKKTGDKLQFRYPAHLHVKERHPQIDINTNDSVAGVTSGGEVTVANGLETKVSNIEVTINGDGIDTPKNRTVNSTIAPGRSVTVPFRFRPSTSGTQQLTATVNYTIDGAITRTTTRTTVIEPEPLRDRVYIDTATVGHGADRALQVTVSNNANAPISDMVVSAKSDNASFQRVFINNISPSSSKQVRLNATLDEPHANVRVITDYELGSSVGQINKTTEIRSTQGSIILTGIDITRQNNRIQISGSASNIGSTTADGVLIRVINTRTTTPVAPNRDYFVGTVPDSDFVSFELYARTEGNVTTLPIEVSYVIENDRREERFSIPLRSQRLSQGTPDTVEEKDQFGLLLKLFGGLILLLSVATLIYYRLTKE